MDDEGNVTTVRGGVVVKMETEKEVTKVREDKAR